MLIFYCSLFCRSQYVVFGDTNWSWILLFKRCLFLSRCRWQDNRYFSSILLERETFFFPNLLMQELLEKKQNLYAEYSSPILFFSFPFLFFFLGYPFLFWKSFWVPFLLFFFLDKFLLEYFIMVCTMHYVYFTVLQCPMLTVLVLSFSSWIDRSFTLQTKLHFLKHLVCLCYYSKRQSGVLEKLVS